MSLENTVELAKGKWKGLMEHFGVESKLLDGNHHACPLCGGKDRFRFEDDNGSGSYYCSGCGPGYGMGFLMKFKGGVPFGTMAKEIDKVLGIIQTSKVKQERTDQDKMDAVYRLLKTSVPIAPSDASWLYLERRCGASAELLQGLRDVAIQRRSRSADPGKDPTVLQDLRFHMGIKHGAEFPGKFPALLATMRYPDDTIASVHRTFLTPEGRKAEVDPVRKIMPGLPLEGSAVRLGAIQERLGIAEGIETAICAGKLFGLPVWAGISANGILSWVPPEGVRSVLILGDNDSNFVGLAAAYEKARQLRAKGFDVEVQIPPVEGQDWCDVWGQQAPLRVVA